MRHRQLLVGLWLACLLAGLGCGWVFVAGVLRDTHFEQAELALDLGTPTTEWHSIGFRVWGGGPYALWLTTLGRDEPFDPERQFDADEPSGPAESLEGGAVGGGLARFAGELEVRVLRPDGRPRLERRYTSQAFEAGPEGGPPTGAMSWTRLESLRIDGWPVRSWTLEARVVRGDPALAAARDMSSRLLLRRDRPDRGMGGLLTYVMAIPAGAFLLLSLGLALANARRAGSLAPVWISGALLLALLGFFVA